MPVLGIDPGKLGGAVLLSRDGEVMDVWTLTWLGKTKHRQTAEKEYRDRHVAEMQNAVRQAQALSGDTPIHCFLEYVTGFRGMTAPANSVLTLGRGLWWGVVAAAGIPVHHPTPQQWQPEFLDESNLPEGMRLESAERKRRLKAEAQRLWPDHKWTSKTADAGLIAEWGRRELLAGGQRR